MKTPTGRESAVSDVRRRQIIDAAGRTIAAEGLTRASLSRIAAAAGLSSVGLITYHFGDRQQLLRAITNDVDARHLTALDEAVDDGQPPGAALDRYISATVAFQDRNRSAVQAAWQIVWLQWSGTLRSADQEPPVDRSGSVIAENPRTDRLVAILERGRATGDFRSDFASDLMARTINSATLGYMDLVASCDTPDPDAFTVHLQRTFAAALQPTTRTGGTDCHG